MGPRSELIEEGQSIPWFHAIDFGDWTSPGRSAPGANPNSTLLPVFEFMRHIDFAGRDVLDIGTADGLVAFAAEALGASRVVATDGTPRRPFEIARELIGSSVEYVTHLPDVDLLRRKEGLGRFDIIILAGFLYHVWGPLNVVGACRNLLRPGGLILVETVYTGDAEPVLRLNTEMDPPLTEQISSYFIGSPPAIHGMLKLACFDCLASASLGPKLEQGGVGRYGVVARAVSPDNVSDRLPQLMRTHSRLAGVPEVSFRDLRRENYSNPVAYARSHRDHTEIPPGTYPHWIPFQPE